jgi:hypothetical protein
MKPSVYLETTIVSYRAARPSRDLLTAAHQQATHDWFAQRADQYRLFVSDLVVREAREGDVEAAARRAIVLGGLRVLDVDQESLSLAAEIVKAGCVPPRAAPDAVHVAVSATNELDFLLTWNCTHINNAATKAAIETACIRAGYRCPMICTPEELMGDLP